MPDNHFAAATAVGVLTLGHAGPDSFDELIRITRPGGVLIFSVRVDTEPGTGFHARQGSLEREGRWRLLAKTNAFQSLPLAEPDVLHRVFVYEVCP